MDLFGNESRNFRAVWVQMEGMTEPIRNEELAELSTVNWSKYAKGNYVNLQRVKAKFLSYNITNNTVYLEAL